VALALTVPSTARADDDPPVTLRWNAPKGCPSSKDVVAEVRRLLGPRTARPAKPLSASATVVGDAAAGFRVHLETPSNEGPRVRELDGSTCLAVGNATALILALMIDPAAVASTNAQAAGAPTAPPAPAPPPSSPVPVEPPPPPSSAAPVAPPATATTSPVAATRPLRPPIHLAAWALADFGTVSGPTYAVGGEVAVTVRAVRVELGGSVLPSQRVLVPGSSYEGGRVGLIAGFAGACYDVLAPRSFTLAPCLGVELGWLHATSVNVALPGSNDALWSGFRAGGLFEWFPIQHFGLFLRGDAVVPFKRTTFYIRDYQGMSGKVGSLPPPGVAVARLGGGIDVRF
jgi:hypothetical protein